MFEQPDTLFKPSNRNLGVEAQNTGRKLPQPDLKNRSPTGMVEDKQDVRAAKQRRETKPRRETHYNQQVERAAPPGDRGGLFSDDFQPTGARPQLDKRLASKAQPVFSQNYASERPLFGEADFDPRGENARRRTTQKGTIPRVQRRKGTNVNVPVL